MASPLSGSPRWRCALALLLVALFAAAPAGAADDPLQDARNLVHMLDYVSVDYPEFVRDGEVLDQAEYQEQLEFSGQVQVLLARLPENPAKPSLLAQAQQLKSRIQARAPGDEISGHATALRWAVIEAYSLAVAPKHAPDMKLGARLYAANCAGCHGVDGRGDGPAAQGMEPAPSNFHDAGRMEQRSLYGLYSTITLGVEGTPMPAFGQLSEDERWALAFYAGSLGADPAVAGAGAALWKRGVGRHVFSGLKDVATLTRKEAAQKHGADTAAVMAWLAGHPQALVAADESPIGTSKRLLAESLEAYRRGEREAAQRLAATSYLEGFELAEAGLDTLDSGLRVRVEREMMAYRSLLRSGAPLADVQRQVAKVQELLDRSAAKLGDGALPPTAAAISAFVILLREGLEAILVLAAVAAFLVRAQRRDTMKYVHAGWIGALLLGIGTWFAAGYLVTVSGAQRELTEGVTALLAAAILLYVGFWLHGKAYARAWKEFIEQRLQGALSKGAVGALVAVSFLAVYREVFETVLFYQALWAQAGDGGRGSIFVGFLCAAAALAAISWAVFRYGVRLPIGPFFAASSILLALLAVVFAGKGAAALQEAGRLPADPVSFPSVPALGIYPTAQSLGLQTILLCAIVAGFAFSFYSARRAGKPQARG